MRRTYGYIWGTILVLLLWWALALLASSPALPSPIETIPVLADNFTRIAPEFWTSLWRLLVAMLIGTVIGAPIGLILGRSKKVDAILGPATYILYPLPKIVLLPILFVLFGIGSEAKIMLIAIAVFFQMVVTMRDAARNIPAETVEAMISFGAERWRIMKDVVIPGSLPSLFTALRVTTASSVAILFIAESMAGSSGLGYFIMHSWSILEYKQMFAGIIAMAVMGVLLYEIFDISERALTKWRL